MPLKPVEKIKGKLRPKKLAIFLVFLVVFFLGFILILGLVQKRFGVENNHLTAKSTPTPLREKTFPPSKYATDSAILEIQQNLVLIEKDLSETDLYETSLNPPVLDMRVSF